MPIDKTLIDVLKDKDLDQLQGYLLRLSTASSKDLARDVQKKLKRLPQMLPLQVIADHLHVTEKDLLIGLKAKEGTPEVLPLRRGLNLVDVDQFCAWVSRQRVPGIGRRRDRRKFVQGAILTEEQRRQHVRVEDESQDTSES